MMQIFRGKGCFACVLEKIPSDLSKKVSKKTGLPLIGIGAGSHVDGQVLFFTIYWA